MGGLSKTVQRGSLNFFRTSPTISRCKSKILEVAKYYRVIQQLKEGLNGKLKELKIFLKEFEEVRITNLVEKYAKSMWKNIEAMFPQTTCKTLESFGIFDMELVPISSLPSFCVYGKNEIRFLAEQFSQKNLSRLLWQNRKNLNLNWWTSRKSTNSQRKTLPIIF